MHVLSQSRGVATRQRAHLRWLGGYVRGRIMVGLVLLAVLFGVVTQFNAGRRHVIRTVTVGRAPVAIAVDEWTRHAFVVSRIDGTVSVLDTGSGAVLRTVTVDKYPGPVAVDSGSGHAFVAMAGSKVSMLNARSGVVLHTTVVPGVLSAVAVDRQTEHVFVADALFGTVSVLDARHGSLLRTTTVGGSPLRLTVDERTKRAFVADSLDNSVSVLDTGTGALLHTVTVGQHPMQVPANARAGHVFVTVDTRTDRVFVGSPIKGVLAMLDARSGHMLRLVTLIGTIDAAAVDEQSGHVFVAGSRLSAGMVSMLDVRNGILLRTTTVAATPTAVGVDEQTGRVFVVSAGPLDAQGRVRGNGSVSVLDARSGALLDTISVGAAPVAVAVDERAGHVFVVNSNVNPNGGLIVRPEGWWAQWQRRVHQRLSWVPQPPAPTVLMPGSVSVLTASSL